jgi:hypothetical protein
MSSNSKSDIVDLTGVGEPAAKKQKASQQSQPSPGISAAITAPKPTTKVPKVSKKELPHVLIWVCTHGKGQGRTWSQKSLKIIGVYQSKEEAEAKKQAVMEQYDQCGHGDITVGGTWEDEINLVVRPAGECTL